jgi:hypothetical protein
MRWAPKPVPNPNLFCVAAGGEAKTSRRLHSLVLSLDGEALCAAVSEHGNSEHGKLTTLENAATLSHSQGVRKKNSAFQKSRADLECGEPPLAPRP